MLFLLKYRLQDKKKGCTRDGATLGELSAMGS
jgi:hypothetical protein